MKPIIVHTLVVAALCTFAAAPAFADPLQRLESPQRQPVCEPMLSKATRQALSKGKCFDGWKQKKTVSDYMKRGLKAPGKGMRWIEGDGVYLLVNITSGIVDQIVKHR